jgi:cation diffusion facilitator family transporter
MSTRVGWYSLVVNTALFALNLTMAAFSGSLALTAETAHNMLDLIASVSVLAGLTLSQRKSRAFPYGLYKVENVVAVFIALTTFFTGYEIAKEALLAPSHAPDVRPVMLAGVLVAAAIPLAFSQYELRVGRAFNSPSLIADATEFRAHLLSSGIVFAALAGQLLGFPLDRLAALVIVVWIAYAGWGLLVDGMRVLLDASVDMETLNTVRALITAQPEVANVKSLTGRDSGRYRFIEVEVTLRVSDLARAHQIATAFEKTILAEVPRVERVLIHTEPAARDHVRVAVPLATRNGAVAAEFGSAPFFALFDLRVADGGVEHQEIAPNPAASESKGRGLKVAEWLIAQRADVALARETLEGKGPGYALLAAGVEIAYADATTLDAALAEWRSREIESKRSADDWKAGGGTNSQPGSRS